MEKSNNNTSAGLGFVGALQILFIGLKLVPGNEVSGLSGSEGWSWWWVLSPIWITTLLAMLILGVVFTVLVIRAGRN